MEVQDDQNIRDKKKFEPKAKAYEINVYIDEVARNLHRKYDQINDSIQKNHPKESTHLLEARSRSFILELFMKLISKEM